MAYGQGYDCSDWLRPRVRVSVNSICVVNKCVCVSTILSDKWYHSGIRVFCEIIDYGWIEKDRLLTKTEKHKSGLKLLARTQNDHSGFETGNKIPGILEYTNK